MNKLEFVEYCKLQLQQDFFSTKNGKPDNVLKHRTEGLMLAGEMLGAISRTEASELIEQVHCDIFGESISERAVRKKSLQQPKELSPDEYFEIPAIERQK